MNIIRPATAHPFPKIATAVFVAAALLIHAGCTTAKSPAPEEEPVPELAPSPPPTAEPEPEPQPIVVKPEPKPSVVSKTPPAIAPPVEPVPELPEHLKIRIESNPVGAMIVVDGKPLGRTPVELEVDAANNGFFKAPMTIRARFVASDAASESVSVDERLGPLERVPQALVFSREGVQRVIRQH
ncbi:MAG TPA: PEGA domain-containing protein [Opitutaceae bacterium]|nr:PEGA domain-containing protein [Opitutaceae bacterium]